MEFDGKVALVTGAASGIGAAAAELLTSRGATVVRADINYADADGSKVHLDISDEQEVTSVVDSVVGTHGRLDVLVTAAGINVYGTLAESSTSDWRKVLSVNLDGTYLVIRGALPALRASGTGAIVVVSSVQAFVTQTGVAAYTASKGALNALVRSIAVDEAAHGVRANAVCPGSVDTAMLRGAARDFSDGTDAAIDKLIVEWGRSHPLGRVARADEVAEAIAFLASDRASFVTGIALPVDGGLLAQAAVVLPD